MDNNENLMQTPESSYKDSHGSGVLSTMVFMAAVVLIMVLLKMFLHY